MASSVKSRANHYETLGLSPGATDAEISEAFRRKISLAGTRSLGAAAQICIAHEVLRDPVKRQEHDRQVGVVRDEPAQTVLPVAHGRWAPFIASPRFNPALQHATNVEADSALPMMRGGETDVPVDPRVAAIAAALDEVARPVVAEGPTRSTVRPAAATRPASEGRADAIVQASSAPLFPPARRHAAAARPIAERGGPTPRAPGQKTDVGLEELVREIRAFGHAEKDALRSADRSPIDWKRPAVVAGSLLVGAALFGSLAGFSVKGDVVGSQAEAAARAELPVKMRHRAAITVAGLDPVMPTKGVQAEAPGKLASLDTGHASLRVVRHPSPDEQVAAAAVPKNDVGEPPVENSEPTPGLEAQLPLSNEVVARTIRRIGYGCDQVASKSAAPDGGVGVFMVTCTSGQSYRATPVGRRYHFRRERNL